MAITKPTTQVKWNGTADTTTITSGSSDTSEILTPDVSAIELTLEVKADNQGTPASGDVIEVYLQRTIGDPDADPDVTDEYETNFHGLLIGVIDTNLENPAITVSASLSANVKAFQVHLKNLASSNSILCSAQLQEMRSS